MFGLRFSRELSNYRRNGLLPLEMKKEELKTIKIDFRELTIRCFWLFNGFLYLNEEYTRLFPRDESQ
jgi:hypothetical protein